MGKIRVLDDRTINQIAAGEVIENPASVIKELIENARDAGARHIRVETKAAGRAWIQVSDDGHGMDAEDLLLSVERHATSKIVQAHDLLQLQSLGFRGEALASIASVSKLQIHSSTGKGGHLLSVSGSQIEGCTSQARCQGTTVDVKQLFYNVPVRRAFQKSMASDTAEIHKTLTKFVLSVLDVALVWFHDGELQFEVLASYDLMMRIQQVLGQDYASNLLSVDKLGCIGKPVAHRPNRMGQFITINGRSVTSPWISKLVLKGYGTSLPAGRFPIFVLHLELPTQWVDVNVHPQKHEVRLQEQQLIEQNITTAVEKALVPPRLSLCVPQFKIQSAFCSDTDSEQEVVKSYNVHIPDLIENLPLPESPTQAKEIKIIQHESCPEIIVKATPLAIFSHYLILETEDGLKIMDLQRALHRIRFENILKSKSCDTQFLLLPQTLEVSEEERVFLLENMEALQEKGLYLRHFGGGTFLVEALPDWISLEEVAEVIRQIVQNGLESCARIVSRCCIKRSYVLEEACAILEQLEQCSFPRTTPEGAAIFIELTLKELYAKFQKT
ncbi:MAG: DNA mismatch repair endonuclease MutL [Verrucomicrobia bacterium]|nr:DNA mismatch repair endonuclease MutL [Verrucomicrobiota bacterium]MBS0646274.1 DNA mismatch repair endonuclease MutL [Verrucomicrobiota bacterium]